MIIRKKAHIKLLLITLLLALNSFSVNTIIAGGKVYLVIGSDTAIWDGMNTSQYNCTYSQSLYTDMSKNAYKVMDPLFRSEMTDSYGQPMKLTWWMMAGNIFRYATNENVPVPNIMTLYLMKKYHGENIKINNDELSLHYHTFHWSDYDRDGKYYWNQSKTFLECLDDFQFTLAQFLLEEEIFPVSFRSGWHYMDNDWQNYLDDYILPYSMHNDFPAKRLEDSEPIDNIFDWSQAPSEFVPYHPAKENYQIPGNGPGWQVRSASFQKVKGNDLMRDVFDAASSGIDQVACFWAHLPESDFPENLIMIDSLANFYAHIYPDVEFQYCTAVEAMKLWRGNKDNFEPNLNIFEEISGNDAYFNIITDENIFQKQPFVAVKNIYNEYYILDCVSKGENKWRTVTPVPVKGMVKVGVSVCDTFGNQSNKFLSYLPDEKYIDNVDNDYSEVYGEWNTSEEYSWGIDSRYSLLSTGDSAAAVWKTTISETHNYNIYIQFPDIPNRAEQINFTLFINDIQIYTVKTDELLSPKKWNYLSTIELNENDNLKIMISSSGKDQNGKLLVADVVKISAFVKEKDIEISETIIDFGNVSIDDSVIYDLKIQNFGIKNLTVNDIYSDKISIINKSGLLPAVIPRNGYVIFPLIFYADEKGMIEDTLIILSDDSRTPILKKPVSINVVDYFRIIDDLDSDQYQEYGDWRTSVANVYGPTSRYAILNSSPPASARFSAKIEKGGLYEVQEIVPQTVNSTDKALYEIYIDGGLKASYIIDQNEGSGNWVTIGKINIPEKTSVELWIKDNGGSTKGDVIRTDAVRFQRIDEGTTDISGKNEKPNKYRLFQNYPNPFNPVTTIKYSIPKMSDVNLSIYDILGRKLTTLVDDVQMQGEYEVLFDASSSGERITSGIYFYKIEAGDFKKIRKFILLK